MSSNLLNGISPLLMNGAVKEGNDYIIPKYSGTDHVDCLIYRISLPKQTGNRKLHVGFGHKAISTSNAGAWVSIEYKDDGDNVNWTWPYLTSSNTNTSWNWYSGDIVVPEGMTPSALFISSPNGSGGIRITNLTLSYVSPILRAMSEMTATKGDMAMILKGKIKRIKISGMLKKEDIF